jgi:hypothetical protein
MGGNKLSKYVIYSQGGKWWRVKRTEWNERDKKRKEVKREVSN